MEAKLYQRAAKGKEGKVWELYKKRKVEARVAYLSRLIERYEAELEKAKEDYQALLKDWQRDEAELEHVKGEFQKFIDEATSAFHRLGVDPENIQAWLNGQDAEEALAPYIRGSKDAEACPACKSRYRAGRKWPCFKNANEWHRYE